MLAALGVVLLVGWRGLRGEFPITFGQLGYSEAAVTTEELVESQEKRLQLLESVTGVAEPPPNP